MYPVISLWIVSIQYKNRHIYTAIVPQLLLPHTSLNNNFRSLYEPRFLDGQNNMCYVAQRRTTCEQFVCKQEQKKKKVASNRTERIQEVVSCRGEQWLGETMRHKHVPHNSLDLSEIAISLDDDNAKWNLYNVLVVGTWLYMCDIYTYTTYNMIDESSPPMMMICHENSRRCVLFAMENETSPYYYVHSIVSVDLEYNYNCGSCFECVSHAFCYARPDAYHWRYLFRGCQNRREWR